MDRNKATRSTRNLISGEMYWLRSGDLYAEYRVQQCWAVAHT